jgi:hypothetical protein
MSAQPAPPGRIGAPVASASQPTVNLAVPIPLDADAEEGVAGCAIATDDGAGLAFAHGLTLHHFYDPRCWRAIVAAAVAPFPALWPCACPDVWCEHTRDARRVAVVAEVAQVESAELRRWVNRRPVMADTGGGLARRVLAAHAARCRLAEVIGLLDDVGVAA